MSTPDAGRCERCGAPTKRSHRRGETFRRYCSTTCSGRAQKVERGPVGEDTLATVENLAGKGVPPRQVAKHLAMKWGDWLELVRREPLVAEALARGWSHEEELLVGKLFEKAMNGDTTAGIFLLKARHGYRDRGEEAPADNQGAVVVTVPGALSPDQYRQPVTVTPATKQLKGAGDGRG